MTVAASFCGSVLRTDLRCGTAQWMRTLDLSTVQRSTPNKMDGSFESIESNKCAVHKQGIELAGI